MRTRVSLERMLSEKIELLGAVGEIGLAIAWLPLLSLASLLLMVESGGEKLPSSGIEGLLNLWGGGLL
jgi:hypothetical protein